jgi:hypothetical protein
MSKPTTNPDWHTGGSNNVEPSAGRKSTGFTTGGDIPGSGELNWWMNLVYQWCYWLNEFCEAVHTWTLVQTFSQFLSLTATPPATGDAVQNKVTPISVAKAYARIKITAGSLSLEDGFRGRIERGYDFARRLRRYECGPPEVCVRARLHNRTLSLVRG